MDYSERRRMNKLLRKPTNSTLAKSLSLRQKLSRGIHKSSKAPPTPNEKNQKHEITTDVCNLCAEMCGVSDISASASSLLQKHLNQIARLLVHEVLRVMEQSRRGAPQASDIDLASVLIGLEPPFGTTPANFLPIRTSGRTASAGPGGKVFFIRPDKEMDVKALMLREPAGVVYDVSLVAHWLSVNGKQPTSPQNPPPDFLAKMALLNNSFGLKSSGRQTALSDSNKNLVNPDNSDKKRLVFNRDKEDKSILESVAHPRKVLAMSIERREHEISQEVMIYFRELTEACVGASETRRHEALDNATLDPGLQPILPHLVTFITEGVRINVTNHNLAILIYLMRLVKALVDNPHISLEPYLHLLVPTVITCVLNRQLCAKPITDNHWALRDFAAKQLVTLCNRHNTSTNELYNRVTRELSRAMYNWIEGTASSLGPVTASGASFSGPKLSTGVSDSKSNELDKPTDTNVTSTSATLTGTSTTLSTLAAPLSSDVRKVECGDSSSHSLARGPSLGSAINSMNTLYGILVILSEFGAQCLRCMVFPILPPLCHRLTILTKPNSCSGDTDQIFDGDSNTQHSLVSLGIGTRLSPVDQRSFDALKTMMTNRLALPLHDWRLRQGMGVTVEDYRASYECMSSCLFVNHRNSTTMGPSSTTSISGQNPSPAFHHQQQQPQQQQSSTQQRLNVPSSGGFAPESV